MTRQRVIPAHVAVIMDGNGRWAQKQGKKRNFGHNAGMNAMMEAAKHAAELGVKYFTVYALSTENVKNRPEEELQGLYDLLRKYFGNNVKKLHKEGAAVKVIGDISVFPEDIAELLKSGVENSPQNPPFTITFALNYGGRDEIVRALQRLVNSGRQIDKDSLNSCLDTAGLPDPDLIIRTGGEMRLSNFLLWQAAYAELYFTPVLFPDFTPQELDKAIDEYNKRTRRFGGVK